MCERVHDVLRVGHGLDEVLLDAQGGVLGPQPGVHHLHGHLDIGAVGGGVHSVQQGDVGGVLGTTVAKRLRQRRRGRGAQASRVRERSYMKRSLLEKEAEA